LGLQSNGLLPKINKKLKDQLYWARDLIFLFVDNGSTQSADIWLSSSHGQFKEGIELIDNNELSTHGGSFIGVFGLDINGNIFQNVEINYGMVWFYFKSC
jgi:hypothetical protein